MKTHGSYPTENMATVIDMALTSNTSYLAIVEKIGCSAGTARSYIKILEKMAHGYTGMDVEIINKRIDGELLSVRIRKKG